MLTVHLQAGVVFASCAAVATLALTFAQRLIDVEMRALELTGAVVPATVLSAETGVVERERTVRADVAGRAVARVPVNEIRAHAAVSAGRGGTIIDVRFTAKSIRMRARVWLMNGYLSREANSESNVIIQARDM